MTDKEEHLKRLEAEARFQNERVEASHRGEGERRDKFYYLAGPAKVHYDQAIGDVRGKTVLVTGCSEGGVTPLARRGADVTGVDISDSAIKNLNESIAKEGLSATARAVLMDAQNLEFEANSIDLICCTGVLHHLDVAASAQSWARVLKPDGKACLLEPMAWNPIVAAYRILTPSMRTEDEHPLTPRDIKLLRQSFSKVTIHGYALTSIFSLIWVYTPNFLSLREKSFKLFSSLDRVLLKIAPWLVYFCWTAVIEISQPKKAGDSTR